MKDKHALAPSSSRNPCPICGRTSDGDCRIAEEFVLCHHGKSRHPPQHIKRGSVISGQDGQQWAYTGDADDGRTAVFIHHKPLNSSHHSGKLAARSSDENISLARLPYSLDDPPAHMPNGERLNYSPNQWVVVIQKGNEKRYIPHHLDSSGQARIGAGEEPWPLWQQDQAIDLGAGQWIAEAEGEKCAAWFGAAGFVAISQPGHDHKLTSIERRYQALRDAGIAGIVYLADNDKTGQQKARKCASAAASVGLQLVAVNAADVWPGLPIGGSIDDAEGNAAERVASVIKGITASTLSLQTETSNQPVKQRSWGELLDAILRSTVSGDDDEVMELRAEIITRFRRTDAQIEAALFKLHTQKQIGCNAPNEPESLDLSRISGMDWLLEGFIPDNDQTLIWGNAGGGKTTAALAAACAVLRSTGLLDHSQPAIRGSVLFIASDSGAPPLYAAMQDMGMADMPEVQNGNEKRFHVWASDPDQGMTAWAADLRGCIRLLRFIQRHQIRLVLIDSCKAVCSGAGLDYTNNQLVTALLTYFKEVICPHAAVVWLNHDGVAKGAHAGAKAWKEIPSMVHSIIREENKDGSLVNDRRQWRVTKSRMGQTREFYYELNQGELKLCPNQEKVSNCLARVVDVLMGAWQLEGQTSLTKADLVERICMAGGPSRKTLENTLSTATRARHPEVCRAGRGRYKLAPRIADSLKGCILNGKEQGQNPVRERDLSSSRQIPIGTFENPENFPMGIHGKPTNRSAGRRSAQVPSRNTCTPYWEPPIDGPGLSGIYLETKANPEPITSIDDEDSAWVQRQDVA